VTYAGYTQSEDALESGGFCRGVLRNATGTVLWTCTHEHVTQFGAVSCAYQAEGQARAAGLLPTPPPVRWDDSHTIRD
jgi:hypothetical protein